MADKSLWNPKRETLERYLSEWEAEMRAALEEHPSGVWAFRARGALGGFAQVRARLDAGDAEGAVWAMALAAMDAVQLEDMRWLPESAREYGEASLGMSDPAHSTDEKIRRIVTAGWRVVRGGRHGASRVHGTTGRKRYERIRAYQQRRAEHPDESEAQSKQRIAEAFGVSVRTVQRDLENQ